MDGTGNWERFPYENHAAKGGPVYIYEAWDVFLLIKGPVKREKTAKRHENTTFMLLDQTKLISKAL